MGKLEVDGKVSQQERYEELEEIFSGYEEFNNDYGTEFVPLVSPGFDDRWNDCGWGENRYAPRSTEHFRNLLDLAEEYKTIDRINVGTWNGWPEGHMIEPGVFRGEDYGKDYLEVLRDFHQN